METSRPGTKTERCVERAEKSVKYVLLSQLDDEEQYYMWSLETRLSISRITDMESNVSGWSVYCLQLTWWFCTEDTLLMTSRMTGYSICYRCFRYWIKSSFEIIIPHTWLSRSQICSRMNRSVGYLWLYLLQRLVNCLGVLGITQNWTPCSVQCRPF
jgi:hypothetical protein